MMKNGKNTLMKLFALLLLCTAGAAAVPCAASGEPVATASGDPVSVADFVAAGWPDDYAEKLAALKKKHPSWTFEKLGVTGLSGGKYTWDYILKMECDESKNRNLVQSTDSYIVLRDFTDQNLYDSGWYKASKYAVSYLMDSRNFLDEEQIFQFADLGWSEIVTVDMVKTVLRGTFMENACLDGIYSETTYADFFMEAGKRSGANPVYLAVLVRNEQGVAGNSYLISGKVGDRLWFYYSNKITGSFEGKLINAPTSGWTEEELKKYNGYYNYFNIGAGGTGYFQIYLGGVKEAVNGTPEMASECGGSPSWDTRWKSILGGAMRATSKYVLDYQNTFYLQKFNVDPRSSRNFWGQYMQSIFGSYGRASSMYKSYKEGGVLDMPYNFIIPVYDGMPENPCPYPTGREPANPTALQKAESFERVNLSAIPSRLVKAGYTPAKITWECALLGQNDSLPLGDVDLSRYSSVMIEYSVPEKFDSFAGNAKAFIGLTGREDAPFGDPKDPDMSSSIATGRLADGAAGGYLYRRNCTISLSDVAYSGNVYLTPCIAEGQKVMIHNVYFITNKGYEPPEPERSTEAAAASSPGETEADPNADTSPESSGADGGEQRKSSCSSLSPAAAAATCVASAVAFRRRKRD